MMWGLFVPLPLPTAVVALLRKERYRVRRLARVICQRDRHNTLYEDAPTSSENLEAITFANLRYHPSSWRPSIPTRLTPRSNIFSLLVIFQSSEADQGLAIVLVTFHRTHDVFAIVDFFTAGVTASPSATTLHC